MNKLFLKTLCFGLILAFSSCTKEDTPKGTPNCIGDKINQEIKDHNDLKKVYQYEYNGKLVYEFIRCPVSLNAGNDCPNSSIGFFIDENCISVCDKSPPFVPTGVPSCVLLHRDGINKKQVWSAD